MKRRGFALLVLIAGIATPLAVRWSRPRAAQAEEAPAPRPAGGHAALAEAAFEETQRKVIYDPAYVKIPYPGGDVPADRGVCADVVIRAFRRIGIDLQKEVHEDMTAHFKAYPDRWGLKKPDPNIDHRRVPNLMMFFQRRRTDRAITSSPADYAPGDIVAWDLGRGVLHIGIVSDRKSADGKRCQVVHNIGGGQVLEDVLFDWKVIGHYRWPPAP